MARSERAGRRDAYHHGDLRSALIAAARTLLERDGPEAISLRAVARAVGVSQTAPYNHFRSREHLLATLAESGFRELEASQRAAAADTATTGARLDALGRAYVAFARAHPQLYRLMFGVGIADWNAHPDAVEAKKAAYRPVRDALVAHLAAGGDDRPETVETASVVAWALVHGLATLLIDRALVPKEDDPDGDRLIARVTAWFSAGLNRAAGVNPPERKTI